MSQPLVVITKTSSTPETPLISSVADMVMPGNVALSMKTLSLDGKDISQKGVAIKSLSAEATSFANLSSFLLISVVLK